MPILLLFAPCEKVIIAHDNNTVSLISILQDFTIAFPANVQIPETVAVPFRWYGFAMWQKQAQDEGKHYVQEIEFCDPDGTVILTGVSQFEISLPIHRVIAELAFFPVRQSGSYTLKLYLREDKQGEEKKLIASFPLTITKKVEG